MPESNVFSIDGYGEVQLTTVDRELDITYSGPASHALYVAVERHGGMGSGIAPFGKDSEGSTVFLPFWANSLYYVVNGDAFVRTWEDYTWSERRPFRIPGDPSGLDGSRIAIPLHNEDSLDLVIYVKDLLPELRMGQSARILGSEFAAGLGRQDDQFLSARELGCGKHQLRACSKKLLAFEGTYLRTVRSPLWKCKPNAEAEWAACRKWLREIQRYKRSGALRDR